MRRYNHFKGTTYTFLRGLCQCKNALAGIFSLLFIYVTPGISQVNLINNGGFEQHGHIYRAVCQSNEFSKFVNNWEALGHLPPHQIYLTKDYQPNVGDIEQLHYDLDRFPPHSGKSMVRFWAHPSPTSETCTKGHGGNIYSTLSKPIQAGQCHKISFWYYIKASAGSQNAPDFFENFGITLYHRKPSNTTKLCLSVSNSPLMLPKQETTDEEKWKKQEFYVVTENSFTSVGIGFFNSVASQFEYNTQGLHYYLHIDDVQVTPLEHIPDSIRNKIIYYPNPMDYDHHHFSEDTEMDYAVYFDTNLDSIATQYLSRLDSLAELLKKYPNHTIMITGFTDATGDGTNNLFLSQRRAAAVKNYLVKTKKIKEFRIFTQGKGVDTQGNLRQAAQNRRVDIEDYQVSSADILFQKASAYGAQKRADSTLYFLRAWLTVEPEHWMRLYIDPNLTFLNKYKSWAPLEEEIKKKYNKYQKPDQAFQLEKLYYFDQKYRSMGYTYTSEVVGTVDSVKLKALELEWNRNNLKELLRITKDLEQAPDPTEVSKKAYLAIFYTLQHSDDVIFQKKFTTVLEGHCLFFQRWCEEYAKMYDQLLLDETGFQKYGTHSSGKPSVPDPPLIHPEKLNEYRKSIHLGRIGKQ